MKIFSSLVGKLSLAFIFSAALISCGNEDSAPADGSIIINPSSINIADSGYVIGVLGGACGVTYPPQYWDLEVVRIAIVDKAGNPLGLTNFSVNLSWTGGTTNAGEVGWVFDDDIGDGNGGVTDAAGALQINELVSAVGDPALYTTRTNSEGYKDLYIVMDAACVWTGQLDVLSGPLGAAMNITKG